MLPAKANCRKLQASNNSINFNGSAFAPPRDEELTIKIDNDIYTRKPQNQSFLAKVLRGIKKALVIPEYDTYTVQVHKPQDDGHDYSISYYA